MSNTWTRTVVVCVFLCVLSVEARPRYPIVLSEVSIWRYSPSSSGFSSFVPMNCNDWDISLLAGALQTQHSFRPHGGGLPLLQVCKNWSCSFDTENETFQNDSRDTNSSHEPTERYQLPLKPSSLSDFKTMQPQFKKDNQAQTRFGMSIKWAHTLPTLKPPCTDKHAQNPLPVVRSFAQSFCPATVQLGVWYPVTPASQIKGSSWRLVKCRYILVKCGILTPLSTRYFQQRPSANHCSLLLLLLYRNFTARDPVLLDVRQSTDLGAKPRVSAWEKNRMCTDEQGTSLHRCFGRTGATCKQFSPWTILSSSTLCFGGSSCFLWIFRGIYHLFSTPQKYFFSKKSQWINQVRERESAHYFLTPRCSQPFFKNNLGAQIFFSLEVKPSFWICDQIFKEPTVFSIKTLMKDSEIKSNKTQKYSIWKYIEKENNREFKQRRLERKLQTWRQLQTPLDRIILIEKLWFLVNFVQQCFAKAEALPKCRNHEVHKKYFDVEVDVFNFKRHV